MFELGKTYVCYRVVAVCGVGVGVGNADEMSVLFCVICENQRHIENEFEPKRSWWLQEWTWQDSAKTVTHFYKHKMGGRRDRGGGSELQAYHLIFIQFFLSQILCYYNTRCFHSTLSGVMSDVRHFCCCWHFMNISIVDFMHAIPIASKEMEQCFDGRPKRRDTFKKDV